jgi:hypothetical protein
MNILFVNRQALGGAIRNAGGTLSLQDCYFFTNSAIGGDSYFLMSAPPPEYGLDGFGGAIHNSGALTAVRCSFLQNVARGGAGCTPQSNPTSRGTLGGSGAGGAIYTLGTVALRACALVSNTAAGGTGGRGEAGWDDGQHIWDGAAGGAGGSANGGALCNLGTANLVNNTLAWNSSVAGAGGAGGSGGSTVFHGITPGAGGAGGAGGSAYGGGTSGTANLTNCSLAYNSAILGTGGLGGSGGQGNGVPHGPAGTNGLNGVAGGGGVTGGTLLNTLLASNTPSANCYDGVTDAGNNLSSDASCSFIGPGSLNNTDPKLGPLANNGGPTLTMALLSGSPAIDAGHTSLAPATDQRGVPRPFSLAADIGAFEFWPTLRASPTGLGGVDILASGISGQTCRLLNSSNFLEWLPLATNQIGTNGTVLFYDNWAPGSACRFYRLVTP